MLRALLVPKNGWYEVKQKRVFSEKAHGAKAIQGHPIHKFIFYLKVLLYMASFFNVLHFFWICLSINGSTNI